MCLILVNSSFYTLEHMYIEVFIYKLFTFQCKPEQVQAVQDAVGEGQMRREQLLYRVEDVITVLDKS